MAKAGTLVDVFQMVYDDEALGDGGVGNHLGCYKIVKNLSVSDCDDIFIGTDVDNGAPCLVHGKYVSGHRSGLLYRVYSLADVCRIEESEV